MKGLGTILFLVIFLLLSGCGGEAPRPTKVPIAPAAEIVSEGATPLERINLGQVKLVALIWNIHNPRAMVEDAGGKGYIIAKGTPIGKSKGIVTQITSAGGMIKEKDETPAGKVGPRAVTLKLYPD